VFAAQQAVAKLPEGAVPDEPLPWRHGHRAVGSPRVYGMREWGDLFTARQLMANEVLRQAIEGFGSVHSVLRETASLALSRRTDISTALCRWSSSAAQVVGLFGRQALPMLWDFAESSPFGGQAGDYIVMLHTMCRVIDGLACLQKEGQVRQADASKNPLSTGTAAAWFTDPPYHDNVPYADLSDFFLVWLKRTLPNLLLLRDPFDTKNRLSPKERELTVTTAAGENSEPKTTEFFLPGMAAAFADGRRVIRDDGVACVVFAHKSTEGWEALLTGMLRGGWTISESWPISTERADRMVARDTAALAGSVHLVCRPRPADAGSPAEEDGCPALIEDWENGSAVHHAPETRPSPLSSRGHD
jgi:adenine-specific DNA methylase